MVVTIAYSIGSHVAFCWKAVDFCYLVLNLQLVRNEWGGMTRQNMEEVVEVNICWVWQFDGGNGFRAPLRSMNDLT